MNYWKMKELAELLMTELENRTGPLIISTLLKQNGWDANTLADMGFSESFLYGLGMSVEDDRKQEQKPSGKSAPNLIYIRDRVKDLIPQLQNHDTHETAMSEL